MKSFNQFLQESYLNEELPPGMDRDTFNRLPAKSKRKLTGSDVGLGRQEQPLQRPKAPNYGGNSRTAVLNARKSGAVNTSPGTGNSNKLPIPNPPKPQGTTTTVPGSSVRGETGRGGTLTTTPKPGGLATNPPIEAVKVSDVTKSQGKLPSGTAGGAVTKTTTSTPSAPVGTKSNPQRIYPTPTKSTPAKSSGFKPATINAASSTSPSVSGAPAGAKPPTLSSTNARRAAAEAKKAKAAAGSGPSGKATPMPGSSSGGKPPTLGKTANPKSLSRAVKPSSTTGKFPSGLGRNLGRAAYGLEAGLETLDQKSRGRKTGSAIAMGATKAAGGWAGAKAGAAGGAALGSLAGPIGTGVGAALGGIGGYYAGSNLAGKASETVAGATGKEKAAMATANRKSQAGGAIKGIGGKTTFDTNKNTITTGTGAQRKTAQLGKTSVITGPGGKQEVGNLAYKGGKAVYKRSDTKSLAQTSSNPLERIGRSLFAGAYKQSDAANAAKKLATARQSDANRQKALGVKFGPGK